MWLSAHYLVSTIKYNFDRICGNYVDSRSYHCTRTRSLEAPPGLSGPTVLRRCASQDDTQNHKGRTETSSQGLAWKCPPTKCSPIGMRSRRLRDGLFRPELGTLKGCPPAPAPSPTVQAPSLAGHGQTALGPRPIPRRSHLELNPRSRLISPGWRGKTLMSSSADSPAFPPVRADAAGAAGARYIRPARVRSYPLPHPPCSVSRGPEHMA